MARKFIFDWRAAVLVLLLLPLMIGLGFWQLYRANHNKMLLLQAEQQRLAPPMPLVELLQKMAGSVDQKQMVAWHLQPVVLRGRWSDKVFLLENQIYQERNGYYVFGVMQLDGDVGSVLVNRGWIAAPALRSELPSIPVVAVDDEMGELYVSPLLGEDKSLFAEQGWPKRIGRMNIPGAEEELHTPLLPVVVRLKEGSPSALAAQWPIVNIQPEKNTAYAVQWFAMAFALLLCYGFYSYRTESIK
ncbi:MAG: SURF1 family protein [Pseudomonadales bacterium]